MDQCLYSDAYDNFKAAFEIREEIFSEFNSYLADTYMNLSQSMFLIQQEMSPEDFENKFKIEAIKSP